MPQVSLNAIRTTRRRASRTNPDSGAPAFDEHARQIGEIIYLWNKLQGDLFWIFFGLTRAKKADWFAEYETAMSIWHSIQSDKTQKEMVAGVARWRLAPRLRSHVLWLCRAHEKLSPYRNAFAHVGFHYHWETNAYIPYDLGARKSALERLAAYPKRELFRKLRGDLAALSDYASSLGSRIHYPRARSPCPSTERPRLLLVPASTQKPSKAPRPKNSEGRERPPASSPQ